MASGGVYRAKGARSQFGGANLDHDQISIDMNVDDIPSVGFEDVQPTDGETYDDGAMGIVGHTLSGGGYWDAFLNPHGNPPGFRAGLYIGPNFIFLNKVVSAVNANAVRWYGYALVRVLGGRSTAQIRGRWDFSFNVKSCGLVVYPG